TSEGGSHFGLDAALNTFVIQNPPENGRLLTDKTLGLDFTEQAGLDIDPFLNLAYLTLQSGGTSHLYTLELQGNGLFKDLGAIGTGAIAYNSVAVVPAGAISFSSNSYSATEGNGALTITINRLGGSSGTISVRVFTHEGTATPGSDYAAVDQIVTFGPGETTAKTVSIPIVDDSRWEGDEHILVSRNVVSGGAPEAGASPAVVTIHDNDPAPPLPTLSEWAFLALAALLGAIGIFTIRR
ncbi:MAG TPA: IPTL-CTERM sorting domain-containing protein, partial [Thermoanaerobaculia bacterium]|nr:IPTL-CTERM sorting domain-containing protein [Thermoanaerobaculia bacterium]